MGLKIPTFQREKFQEIHIIVNSYKREGGVRKG